jgi:hypothetical protein
MAKPKKPILTSAVLRGVLYALRHTVTEDQLFYRNAGAKARNDLRRGLEWATKMTEYRKLPESVRNSRFTGKPIPENFNTEP